MPLSCICSQPSLSRNAVETSGRNRLLPILQRRVATLELASRRQALQMNPGSRLGRSKSRASFASSQFLSGKRHAVSSLRTPLNGKTTTRRAGAPRPTTLFGQQSLKMSSYERMQSQLYACASCRGGRRLRSATRGQARRSDMLYLSWRSRGRGVRTKDSGDEAQDGL